MTKPKPNALPFDLSLPVHFAGQAQALFPWEVMLTDHERDQLDIAFEEGIAPKGGVRLKFQLVPATKELYGNRRELIIPIEPNPRTSGAGARLPPAAVSPTPKKKGGSKGPGSSGPPRGKRGEEGAGASASPSGKPILIHGWKESASDLITDLKAKFPETWASLEQGPNTFPFYNEVVGSGSLLTYALVEMKLRATKADVKEIELGNNELGYRHSFRWLTEMRILFSQHFQYILRVNKKDTSVSIPAPHPDHPYPSPQDLDLMEVDLRRMVEYFERMALTASTPLTAYCMFEGVAPEKRVPGQSSGPKHLRDDDIPELSMPSPPRASSKRPWPGGPDSPSPASKKNKALASPGVKGMLAKASQGDLWALDFMDDRVDSHELKVVKKDDAAKSSYSLKENASVPVEPPQNSALDHPELPSVANQPPIPAHQLEKCKKRAHIMFTELDVMYRYAVLNHLSFDLGIHPTLCAQDIDFIPDLELLLPEQIHKYVYWTRHLHANQQKMSKVFQLPIATAESGKNRKKNNRRVTLSDEEVAPLSPAQNQSSPQVVVGSLASIGGTRTVTADPSASQLPMAPGPASQGLPQQYDDSSSSVSSSVSSSPSQSPVEDPLPSEEGGAFEYQDESMEEQTRNSDWVQRQAIEPKLQTVDPSLLANAHLHGEDEDDEDLDAALLGGGSSDGPHSIEGKGGSEDMPLGFNSSLSDPLDATPMDEDDDINAMPSEGSAVGSGTWRIMKTAVLHQSYREEERLDDEDDDR